MSRKEPLKIAFFGSSLVSAYWNGAATYYRGIIHALAERGHRVCFFEPDALERQHHRDMQDPPWCRVEVYPATVEGMNDAMDRAGVADVLIKASGVGVLDEQLEYAALDRRRPGMISVFWDVDAPATLERMRQDPADHFRQWVADYDLILTYGGGGPVVEAYRGFGAERCVPIYNALSPDTHHPAEPEPRFRSDLSLLANRLPDREARVQNFFIDTARLLPERRFLLGGSGWENGLPDNIHLAGHVGTSHHNAFNCSALAVLNIHRQSMAECGYSLATRVFEAAGAGACLISDRVAGIDQFFEPDREILLADGSDGVAEHLESLSPERAATIGRAAMERARAEHTYAQRVVEVERELYRALDTSHARTPIPAAHQHTEAADE